MRTWAQMAPPKKPVTRIAPRTAVHSPTRGSRYSELTASPRRRWPDSGATVGDWPILRNGSAGGNSTRLSSPVPCRVPRRSPSEQSVAPGPRIHEMDRKCARAPPGIAKRTARAALEINIVQSSIPSPSLECFEHVGECPAPHRVATCPSDTQKFLRESACGDVKEGRLRALRLVCPLNARRGEPVKCLQVMKMPARFERLRVPFHGAGQHAPVRQRRGDVDFERFAIPIPAFPA
jgi:hypothetical protein